MNIGKEKESKPRKNNGATNNDTIIKQTNVPVESDSDEEEYQNNIDNEHENKSNDHAEDKKSKNVDRDIETMSSSLERLSVSSETPFSTNNNMELLAKLKKNTNVKFKLKDEVDWRSGNLISRSGKLSGKYRNAWNCELNDEDKTITSIDFERDVTDLQLVPNVLIQHKNYSEEIHYSEIYITEIENQSMNAKLLELENWKIQEVYIEEENIGQHCLSVRWVFSVENLWMIKPLPKRDCVREALKKYKIFLRIPLAVQE